jgi:hypothetical protein
MKQIECSETSANINQTPGKQPKENTLNTEQGESLKSILLLLLLQEDERENVEVPLYPVIVSP